MRNLYTIFFIFYSIYSLNAQRKGTMIDIDGNVYKTVVIGTQEWMAENLRTTKYNDGSSIEYIKQDDNSTWENNTTGAYSWYNNDHVSYTGVYGGLYNWYAVNSGKLCPVGWHVPSDKDWTQLENFIGDSVFYQRDGTEQWVNSAGIKLKSENNWDGTDEFGFTALPAGRRNASGIFSFIGRDTSWWSSTEYSSINAWHRTLLDGRNFLYRYNNAKGFGFCVRCVRN